MLVQGKSDSWESRMAKATENLLKRDVYLFLSYLAQEVEEPQAPDNSDKNAAGILPVDFKAMLKREAAEIKKLHEIDSGAPDNVLHANEVKAYMTANKASIEAKLQQYKAMDYDIGIQYEELLSRLNKLDKNIPLVHAYYDRKIEREIVNVVH